MTAFPPQLLPGYVLSYEYQTCFDDGGVGHDSGWEKAAITLHECKTDEEAIAKAKEILAPHRPCGGSFCDNKGLSRNGVLKFREVSMSIKERELELA